MEKKNLFAVQVDGKFLHHFDVWIWFRFHISHRPYFTENFEESFHCKNEKDALTLAQLVKEKYPIANVQIISNSKSQI